MGNDVDVTGVVVSVASAHAVARERETGVFGLKRERRHKKRSGDSKITTRRALRAKDQFEMPKAEISLSTPAPVSGSAILAFFPLLMSPVARASFSPSGQRGRRLTCTSRGSIVACFASCLLYTSPSPRDS